MRWRTEGARAIALGAVLLTFGSCLRQDNPAYGDDDDGGEDGSGSAASESMSSAPATSATGTSSTAGTASASEASTAEMTTGAPAQGVRQVLTVELGALFEPLVDVPLLVRLTPERFDYDAVADFSELFFFDAQQEQQLAHEVESWNPGGASDVWVKVPVLMGSGVDQIVMAYGNSGLGQEIERAEVWDADHVGVWHFGQMLGPLSEVRDSTGNLNHGRATNAVGPDASVPGMAGLAGHFINDPAQDEVRVPDTPSLSMRDAVTVETWVRLDVFNQDEERFAVRKDPGYFLHTLRNFTTSPSMYVHVGGWYNQNSGNAGLGDLEWHYIAGTYDRSNSLIRVYVDGSLRGTADITEDVGNVEITDGTSEVLFGRRHEGDIDEIRISSVARSEDWFAVQNQSIRDEIVSFGPQEPL